MPSPEKRIAVARAICAACHENPDHQGDARGNEYRWQDYLDVADAAIAAMTDSGPTELTKDGVAVKVGQVWKDLDKRMSDRHCKVIAVLEGRAHMNRCAPNGRVSTDAVTKVAIARMHRGSTGWALVSDVQS
jgi:hypothetical protein